MEEAKPFKQRPNVGSRVTREGHARFWERPEVKFLRATRRVSRTRGFRQARGRRNADRSPIRSSAKAALPALARTSLTRAHRRPTTTLIVADRDVNASYDKA